MNSIIARIFNLISISILIVSFNLHGETRLKNIITIKGVRDNPLIGYGLVIGLNGTGDGGGEITISSLKRMFTKLGLNPQQEISAKNVAAVIVTAKLPPFARTGQKIDILVSSIGDAGSLAGGTLLITPLKGGDGEIYAVAQGPVSIGGLNNGSQFATTATISNGATIEKEIPHNFDKKTVLRLAVNNPDFTTSHRIEKIINTNLGGKFASARDSGTIDLMIPTNYKRRVVELMALIENFKVNTDQSAKIVINERTGTIVAGGEIELKESAIAHGNLVLEVSGEGGQEGQNAQPQKFFYLKKGPTLNDLVKLLNNLGTSPEDLISIFQALKKNGALVGEIELI